MNDLTSMFVCLGILGISWANAGLGLVLMGVFIVTILAKADYDFNQKVKKHEARKSAANLETVNDLRKMRGAKPVESWEEYRNLKEPQ